MIKRGVEVIRVPWNYDYTDMQYDGLFLANGPGDPDVCSDAVDIIRKQMNISTKPICGICMGNQLLAKAAGADIYKLKYVHLFFQREKECAVNSKPYQCDSEWNRLVDLATEEEYRRLCNGEEDTDCPYDLYDAI
jgi:carbamoyl-phosphate synthase small subunit